MIEFRVLGELAVRRGHDPVPIPTSMLQRLLALLVCQAGQPVHVDYVADALWDGDPPRTARKTLQVYIHRLRRALGDDARVLHSAAGYLLVAAVDEVDSRVFERLTAQAADARSRGDLPRAAELHEQALGQWRGAAYAGMRDIAALAAEAERLEENRLAALEERIAIGLELGRHAELIGDLTVAVKEHPYRERFHGQLMLALYRNGQQANALEVYRQTHNRLVTELGVEPIPELQRLHQQILANDPALAAASPLVTLTPASRRFLPQDVPDFTGRRDDLELLTAIADSSSKTVVISAVTGMAGIGKTALAVHWAYQIAMRFPDGQLYVNLRGYDPGQPLRPIDGLIHLLRCLGVAPERIPVELDDAAALYRSLLASKRVLILLDNARTADQVRSLLPGEPGCFTVVTSRDRLSGLIAIDGARRLTLGLLPTEDAIHLLRQLIGAARVDAEPAETEELVRLCANLPLALRIAAAHLTDRPEQTIGQYTADLRLGDRIEALEILEPISAAEAAKATEAAAVRNELDTLA